MDPVTEFNNNLDTQNKGICDFLRINLDKHLHGCISKLYHGAPVWFLNDNPLVGYSLKKGKIALLFWSGQSFTQEGLVPMGKFKAAEISFSSLDEISLVKLQTWLNEAKSNIWDYKNIVKNGGKLTRLN